MVQTRDSERSTQQRATSEALPRLRTHFLSSTLSLQQNPLGFLGDLVRQYGDIAQFRLLHMPIIVLNHPDYVKRVLLENHANYDKDVFVFHLLRPMMRDGLVTNVGGEPWLRQRRLVQPAFHRSRVAALGRLITDLVFAFLQQWEETSVAQGQPFDVALEMTHLTLQIISKALFDIDISEKTSEFGKAFAEANRILTSFARFPFPPLNFPTPAHIRLWAAIKRMDNIALTVIQQRRQSGDVGDLLSMMIAAGGDAGESMSDPQLRDEVMTLLLAGHETSANAISWAWYLLGMHREVEERLYAELTSVLAGRTPTPEDLPQLPYLQMIVQESLRLYPPTWQLMRRAREEDVIGGYTIPARSTLFWSQYWLHRHPDFWPDPERFDPERFTAEQVARRHRYAYMPFGIGPRMCIGQSLALTEIQLVLATIAQRYRLVLVSGHQVEALATLALRPKNGVLVNLVRR